MFTGLIREIATVTSFQNETLTIASKYSPKIGDSIAINGACLTATRILENGFEVELSHESQKLLATQNYKDHVHIEPAMTLQDRLDGHILQGHIDCVGEVISIDDKGHSVDYVIRIPKEFIKFVVPKGSIAIDGVSLTVNDVDKDTFRLTIIPITLQETLIKNYKAGSNVNIETDMFARYIYHMFKKENSLTWDNVDNINALY
jgi:riboflavin synthase